MRICVQFTIVRDDKTEEGEDRCFSVPELDDAEMARLRQFLSTYQAHVTESLRETLTTKGLAPERKRPMDYAG